METPAHDRPPNPLRLEPVWPYVAALLALIAAGALLGMLAAEAHEVEADGLDREVLRWVVAHRQDWPILGRWFQAVTKLGNPPFSYLVVIGTALVLQGLHRRRVGGIRGADAAFFLGVTLAGTLSGSLLKLYYRRDRPPLIDRLAHETSFSFPSGHAVFATVVLGMLAVIVWRSFPDARGWQRLGVVAGCVVLAISVALSRIWLAVHYLSDVAGGVVLGLGWLLAAWSIRLLLGRTYLRRRDVDAA